MSEAGVYWLLKAHDLITSPVFVVIKAADEFRDKTMAPNHLWQTDFTYLKVIGWGWFYLSTILDDFSAPHHRLEALHDHEGRGRHRHTLEMALNASGCDQGTAVHKPRLLSGHGSSNIAAKLSNNVGPPHQ